MPPFSIRFLILITLISLITACSSNSSPVETSDTSATSATSDTLGTNGTAESDTESSNFYLSGKNTARLSGPVLGANEVPNDSLRYSVPFTVETKNAEIIVKHTYIIQNTKIFGDDHSSTLIAVLQNVSDEIQCTLKLESITAYDDQGVALAFSDQFFPNTEIVFGSVSYNESSFHQVFSCMAPGEFAYLTSNSDAPFGDISSIAIGEVSHAFNYNFLLSSNSLMPVSYSLTPLGDHFYVRLENRGTSPIKLGKTSFWWIFVLDELGFPVVSRFYGVDEDVILEPGDYYSVSESVESLRLLGTASTLRIIAPNYSTEF